MTTLVVGVGNPDRGDDAAGWVVARGVERWAAERTSGPEHTVVVKLCQGEPAGLVDLWRNHHGPSVLVDAMLSGAPPGTVSVVDAIAADLPPAVAASSHGFGPVEAVALARALGALPPSLAFVGIEARAFGTGSPMSDDVAAGVDHAIALICSWVERGAAPT